MDRDRFDRMTRLFAARQSRRATIAALVSAALLGQDEPSVAKPGRGKKRGQDRQEGSKRKQGKEKGKGRGQVRAQAARCFTGSPCIPGPGKNLGKCDFSDSPALKGKNLKGANLGGATVARGDASGANLSGANLDRTCLVDTNLTGATINGSTNLGTAILCRTTMPDGSENNAGCNKGTNCCPTCDAAHPCPAGEVCCDGRCRSGECCTGDQCASGVCCARVCCAAGQVCSDGRCQAPTTTTTTTTTSTTTTTTTNPPGVCSGTCGAFCGPPACACQRSAANPNELVCMNLAVQCDPVTVGLCRADSDCPAGFPICITSCNPNQSSNICCQRCPV